MGYQSSGKIHQVLYFELNRTVEPEVINFWENPLDFIGYNEFMDAKHTSYVPQKKPLVSKTPPAIPFGVNSFYRRN